MQSARRGHQFFQCLQARHLGLGLHAIDLPQPRWRDPAETPLAPARSCDRCCAAAATSTTRWKPLPARPSAVSGQRNRDANREQVRTRLPVRSCHQRLAGAHRSRANPRPTSGTADAARRPRDARPRPSHRFGLRHSPREENRHRATPATRPHWPRHAALP